MLHVYLIQIKILANQFKLPINFFFFFLNNSLEKRNIDDIILISMHDGGMEKN